jgi:hypothetical protein
MSKENYFMTSDDIISYFKSVEDEFAFPLNLDYSFISSDKQKKLVKIIKIPDTYSILTNTDLLVIINEEYFYNFDDMSKRILFEQEIDRIEVNFEKGTIKIGKPSVSTSFGIIKKFKIENIENALKLEKEFENQKIDKQ